jgi:hypothetical protein
MATVKGQSVQVLVWNYHDDLVTAAAAPVQVNVKLPASFGARVSATHLRVDDTHGDAYPIWMSQGSPAAPSAAQIAALQQGMDPVPLATQALDVAGGSVSLSFDLPRFGISLVTLTPAPATGDGGIDAPVDGGGADRPSDGATSDAPAADGSARDAGGGAGGRGGASGTSGAGGSTGGATGAAGAAGAAGGSGAAGDTAGGGAGGAATGGSGASGSAGNGAAGTSGTGGTTAPPSDGGTGTGGSSAAASGCGCAVDPAAGGPWSIALLTLGLALVSRRARTRSARARSGRPACGRAGAGRPARAAQTAGYRRRAGRGRA